VGDRVPAGVFVALLVLASLGKGTGVALMEGDGGAEALLPPPAPLAVGRFAVALGVSVEPLESPLALSCGDTEGVVAGVGEEKGDCEPEGVAAPSPQLDDGAALREAEVESTPLAVAAGELEVLAEAEGEFVALGHKEELLVGAIGEALVEAVGDTLGEAVGGALGVCRAGDVEAVGN
jgi:hypothetical protein